MTENMQRVRRSPEEARRLILATAQALIARTGPEGLRLQQTAAEFKDRLVAALAQPELTTEALIDRVFDAFAGGLAQRLAWLAIMDPEGMDPEGEADEPATVQSEIAETLHMRRLAAVPPGREVTREDTQWLMHLVAIAA